MHPNNHLGVVKARKKQEHSNTRKHQYMIYKPNSSNKSAIECDYRANCKGQCAHIFIWRIEKMYALQLGA